MEKKKSSFSGSFGFIMAAAASAVGLGNLWRFPNLAAENGGGLFLIIYIILALTFGFTLLTTELAIGRKLKQHPLRAYGTIGKKWKFLGILTFIVPALISTYYSVIGGWILKYLTVYLTGQGSAASDSSYFDNFITSPVSPIVFMLIFMGISAFIVYCGVEKGVEKFSKVVMPALLVLILGVSIFSLTLSHTEDGITRTGIDGLFVYIVPNFEGITFSKFLDILLDAMGQLFYSLSVAMGIMITYGAYVKDDVDMVKSVNRIELFDTVVAFLAGLMIVPAVVTFQGVDSMKANAGPDLMFKALPDVFAQMGSVGTIIGVLFFILVAFAALTSNVSILETLVASCMEKFDKPRKKIALFVALASTIGAVIVCLGYNLFFFKITLPNTEPGKSAQILDVVDYVSNYVLMPVIALCTCFIVGWVLKPKWVIDEMEKGGHKFGRKKLYVVMVKFVAPVMLLLLFFKSIGVYDIIENAVVGLFA